MIDKPLQHFGGEHLVRILVDHFRLDSHKRKASSEFLPVRTYQARPCNASPLQL